MLTGGSLTKINTSTGKPKLTTKGASCAFECDTRKTFNQIRITETKTTNKSKQHIFNIVDHLMIN